MCHHVATLLCHDVAKRHLKEESSFAMHCHDVAKRQLKGAGESSRKRREAVQCALAH